MSWNRIAIVLPLSLALSFVTPPGSPIPAEATLVNPAVAVADFGAPSTFAFSFTTPIVPLNAPVLATLSITAVLTDLTGDGIAMSLVSAALAEGRLEGLSVLGAGGGFSVSDADSDAGESTTFTASATTLYSGGLPPYDAMELFFTFEASGGGDVYNVTLSYEVSAAAETVPVPASLGLLAAGALLLSAAARLRGRRAA